MGWVEIGVRLWLVWLPTGRKEVFSRTSSPEEIEAAVRQMQSGVSLVEERERRQRAEQERRQREANLLKLSAMEQRRLQREALDRLHSLPLWRVPATDQLISAWGEPICHLMADPDLLSPEECDYLCHDLIHA